MCKRLVGVLLFFSMVFIGAVVVDPSLAMKVHRKLNPYGPELREYYHESVSYQRRADKTVLPNAHLFIGDSHIQSLCTSCIVDGAINFGIGRDTSLGVLKRLSFYHSVQTARSVFLSVGINDFKYRSVDEVGENYKRILEIIPRNVDVYVNAVWPVNPEIDARWKGYRERIDTLNSVLEQLCDSYPNCLYVDMTNELSDSDGYLRAAMQTGDGIHLNARGGREVIRILRDLYGQNG